MSKIEEAFKAVPRIDFLRPEEKDQHELDVPLPIGSGQTNSQPSTVRQMLLWLDPQPGDKILDVGSGSGWTTALLAHLVGPTGTIYAVERILELVQFGEENCRRMGVHNVLFFEAEKCLWATRICSLRPNSGQRRGHGTTDATPRTAKNRR